MFKTICKYLFLVALLGMPLSAGASGEYLGAKQCYYCHKDIKKLYLGDMHGRVFTKNPGSSLEEKGCEGCHGPGSLHKLAAGKVYEGQKVAMGVEFPFKKGADNVAANNARCLTCHEKGTQMHWRGSQHEMSDVGCVDCHTIHAEEGIDGTNECTGCHVQKRAQMQRSSHMPLREGKVKCADCHNPHGSMGPAQLKQSSVNENCYTCHQEKRGPFLWEHAPARENCTNCHNAHGSNYDSLLKMKNPYLCESCHLNSYHPGEIYDAAMIRSADKHTLGKGCLNCHPLIHGSNHPSGNMFSR